MKVSVLQTGRAFGSQLGEWLYPQHAIVDPFRIETITAQLQRVLTDTQLEQRLRAAGVQQAATFGPERTGMAMLQLLKTVLD